MSLLSTENIAVQLKAPVVRAVKKGHPWVFDKGIYKQNKPGNSGDLAILYDQKRDFVGIGLFDPESPIKIRVLHRGQPTKLDTKWFQKKLDSVFQRRSELINDPQTTGYRLVSGENDGIPGLVVDRYEGTLVFKLDTVAWLPHLEALISVFKDLLDPERIVLRASRTVINSSFCPAHIKDGCVIFGEELNGPIIFRENGLRFEAEPIIGQKTGFFLDQRDNRDRVGKLSKGETVLNVFSYTGGFSLFAASNAAKSVTSLDLSQPALDAAQRNFDLNQDIINISKTPHILMRDDAFSALEELSKKSQKYGIVILDPPSFAKKQTDIPGALIAYGKLAKLGLQVLKKGGVLVSASCSARVSADDFFETVIRAAAACGRPLQVIEKTGHAVDHPVGFSEGAYLKCLFARG
ncbi:MAG: class I SAM-dependent rRNA methyltransferase [bacterium]|nr:class I SAM-dependent rRNA methyltransferase [bacterium]